VSLVALVVSLSPAVVSAGPPVELPVSGSVVVIVVVGCSPELASEVEPLDEVDVSLSLVEGDPGVQPASTAASASVPRGHWRASDPRARTSDETTLHRPDASD
jgi:hypothetical protein